MSARYAEKKQEPNKAEKITASFSDLMSRVPIEPFRAMVTRSGLPVPEARRLHELFKALK